MIYSVNVITLNIKKIFYRIKNIFKKQRNDVYVYKKIPFLVFGRRSGNTTRLIDSFIQDFFIIGYCKIYDHYNSRESYKRVFSLVISRLMVEHNITIKDLKLEPNRFIIRNLKYKRE
jgi:hypothetical protein